MKIIFSLMLTSSAFAVDWHGFICRHLIAWDPYQFEDMDTESLARRYKIEALNAFKNQKPSDLLKILGDQLRFNHRMKAPLNRGNLEMLKAYESYEGVNE